MALWCVVPAAGSGRRFGTETPKQYLPLNGRLVMQHTLDRLTAIPELCGVVVAVAKEDDRAASLAYARPELLNFVAGGAERADSVLAGLDALRPQVADDDWVLVHDVARPCVRLADILHLLAAVEQAGAGGILANRVRDTMKRSDSRALVQATVSRDDLWHALTPQVFRYGELYRALVQAMAHGQAVTDEASAIERLGLPVLLVEGARDNIKITFPEDLTLAGLMLAAQASEQS